MYFSLKNNLAVNVLFIPNKSNFRFSEILFPVLDVTRLAIRNKDINGLMFDSAYGPNFIKYLLTLLTPGKPMVFSRLSWNVKLYIVAPVF